MAAGPLRNADRELLAKALLLWRYVNHRLTTTNAKSPSGPPSNESCERARQALRIAGRLGIVEEYRKAMMAWPILTIRIDEMGS